MSQIVSRGVVRIRINAKGSAYCRAMSRISYDTINQQVKDASYAVRGPIVTRSMELNSQLATGAHNLPFDEIISCNIVSEISCVVCSLPPSFYVNKSIIDSINLLSLH